MIKEVRDNKLGVIYSSGFGAGWYTWNSNYEQCIYHPTLIKLIEEHKQDEITKELMIDLLKLDSEKDYFYLGGAGSLKVAWIPLGQKFYIHEYDGSEEIWTPDDFVMIAEYNEQDRTILSDKSNIEQPAECSPESEMAKDKDGQS